MSKKITIKNWISYRSYNFGKKNSRTYIYDEKEHIEFVLTGLSSDIWHLISGSKDFSVIMDYAENTGCKSSLENFLRELKYQGLIETNIVDCSNTDNDLPDKAFVCTNAFHHTKTREYRTKWLYKNNFLQMISLQLDENCNLYCEHCFNNKYSSSASLSFDNIKNIIDEAYKLGITGVGITGGECTIHKDFLKIIRYIRSKHLYFTFITNGQKLCDEPDFFEAVTGCYPHEIKISLYSMQSEIHDKITRVKGSCLKTIETIKKLRARNIYVIVNHLRTKSNMSSFEDVKQFAESIGANFNPATYFINNPGNNNSHLKYPVSEIEKTLIKTKQFKDKLAIFKEKSSSIYWNRSICRAGEMNIAVAPNLDVQPCTDFNYLLGNLKVQSLSDIWYNEVPKFKKIFINKNLKECNKEEYCKYCFYCPGIASIENGFLRKSNTFCEHAKAACNAVRTVSLSGNYD